jgi:hypothetical protein
MSCSAEQNTAIASTNGFSNWKTPILTDLNSGSLTSDQLTQAESKIFGMVSCLREKIAAVKSSPTNVSTLQEQVVALQKDLKEKEDQYNVAKERALSISKIEEKTSDYEGWFPLNRPMRSTSLFLLIGFSIFFTLFFFGLVMSLLGFQIRLSWMVPQIPGIPSTQVPIQSKGYLGMLLGWINPLTLAALTALIITSGFLISMATK